MTIPRAHAATYLGTASQCLFNYRYGVDRPDQLYGTPSADTYGRWWFHSHNDYVCWEPIMCATDGMDPGNEIICMEVGSLNPPMTLREYDIPHPFSLRWHIEDKNRIYMWAGVKDAEVEEFFCTPEYQFHLRAFM